MPEQKNRASVLVPLAVAAVAAAVLLGTLLLPGDSGGSGEDEGAATVEDTEQPGGGTTEALEIARREQGDPTAMGPVDAPVVLVAYSDFQCPFCGKWARDTAPALEEQYVEEGILRIEWRDFPYFGEQSRMAARAARAAGEQGKFWEFHDAVYADQPPPNSGKLDREYVESKAEQIGLDLPQFRQDMQSAVIRKKINRDFQEGQSLGVTGTPAFLVNGRPIMGAQPLEVFEKAIENAASSAEK